MQDVDALHAELSQQGYPFDMMSVSDTPWRMCEFHLRDPDRNGLQFYRDR